MISRLIRRYRLYRWKKAGLQIANDCRVMGKPNFGSEPWLISIGKKVTISLDVVFITHDGGTWVFRGEDKYKDVIKYGRIVVGDNVFIGCRAMILPGVEIGENSVIAAGAIVTKSVPSDSVVAGIPARVIMKTQEYAERSYYSSPKYDKEKYRENKKKELLKIYPMPW